MKTWQQFTDTQRQKIRRAIADKERGDSKHGLTHEMVEDVLTEMLPELTGATVEDDDFHFLVSEVYAEYLRNGGVDA